MKCFVQKIKKLTCIVLVFVFIFSTFTTINTNAMSFGFSKISIKESLVKIINDFSEDTNNIEDDLIFTYSFNNPIIEEISIDGNTFNRVLLEDYSNFETPGMPCLPVNGVKILLPRGSSLNDVIIIPGDSTVFHLDSLIEPSQMPIPLIDYNNYQFSDLSIDEEIFDYLEYDSDNFLEFTEPDEKIYGSSENYPGYFYNIVGEQKSRGYNILVLNLFPVQYNPSENKLICYNSFEVTVQTEKTDFVEPFFRGISKDESHIMNIVENPLTINSYNDDISIDASSSTIGVLDESEIFEYVIITSERLQDYDGENNFHDLCNYRSNNGLNAKIVTVEEINSGYSGEDLQEKIRNFIKYAYNNWNTEYILLGGDTDIVPARRVRVASHYDGNHAAGGSIINYMPSDLYYSCLDGNFNGDGDDDWGEGCDNVDLIAEVYIGRASVGDETEVSNFVKKTLGYENSEDDYLKKALWVGEFLGFGGEASFANIMKDQNIGVCNKDGYSTIGLPEDEFEIYGEDAYHLYESGYTVDRLYERNFSWEKGMLISKINNNVHLINHLGHANYFVNMKVGTNDIVDFNNDKYCIIYSQGCLSGAFDAPNYSKFKDANQLPCNGPECLEYFNRDCIAEYLTVKTDNAAVAGIWNARYGWGRRDSTDGPSNRYDREFWDAIFNEGIKEIGRANQDSKEDNIYRISESCMRWCYYGLNLFGDPALKIKGPSPSLSITYPDEELKVLNFDYGVLHRDEIITKSFEIFNNDYGTLNFEIIENCDWLSITPTTGSSNGVDDKIIITITIDTTGLVNGSHNAEIIIDTNIGIKTLEVLVCVETVLRVTPTYYECGLLPDESKTFMFLIENKGYGMLHYTLSSDVDWLSLSQYSGSCLGALEDWDDKDEISDLINVTIDTTGLAAGWYTGQIFINSNGGTEVFTVKIAVDKALMISDNLFDFGEVSINKIENNTFELWNYVENSDMNYNIVTSVDWLSITPESGLSSGEKDQIEIRIITNNFQGCGSYTGKIFISSEGGNAEIKVTLNAYFITVTNENAYSRGTNSPSLGGGLVDPNDPDNDEPTPGSDETYWDVVWNDTRAGRGFLPWYDYGAYHSNHPTSIEQGLEVIDRTMSVSTGLWWNWHYDPYRLTHFIYRSYFVFPTYNIPDDVIIKNASLELVRVGKKICTTDFDMIVQHDPNDVHPYMVYEDMDRKNYTGNGGSLNSTDTIPLSYNKFDLNAEGKSWIDKNGFTRLCVRSSKDISFDLDSYYNLDYWDDAPEWSSLPDPGIPPWDSIYFLTANGTEWLNENIISVSEGPRLVVIYGKEPTIENYSPAHESTVLSNSPILTVEVADPDENSLDVYFYDASDDSLIGIIEDVSSGDIASLTWTDLDYDKTYSWYVIINDGVFDVTSDEYSFASPQSPPNNPPEISSPLPVHDVTDIDITLSELNVYIEDSDDSSFDWSIETSPDIGSFSAAGFDGFKTCQITESLQYETEYIWYVNVTDGKDWTYEIYAFSTEDAPINQSCEITPVEPLNGETDVSVDLTVFTAFVYDPEGDLIDFTIETVPDVGSEDATAYGDMIFCIVDLDYSTDYTWYVNATDEGSGILVSEVFTFTTESEIIEDNLPPYKPSNPKPVNNSVNVDIQTTLSVYVEDPNDDLLGVIFYLNDEIIAAYEDVISCSNISVDVTLEYDTTYEWYAEVQDADEYNFSDVFVFTTKDEPQIVTMELVKPLGGFYLFNEFRRPMVTSVIVGDIDLVVNVSVPSGWDNISKIEFYIEGDLLDSVDYDSSKNQFSFLWDDRAIGLKTITIKLIDDAENIVSYVETNAFIFNIGIL